jgi:hypothetical protein
LINTKPVASSLPEIKAEDPALLIILPVEKGVTSKLYTVIPSGISFNCFLFPAAIGAFSQAITSSPTLIPFHANTYLFSPSA